MWYKNTWRRYLCDMHIADWKDEFLSKLDPEEYLENLKRAKIENAMLYFQSHVGLCYYPTKSGKMHKSFAGREDLMKRLVDMCHAEGISVTGYYSLIYNNIEHDRHPQWRMVDINGISKRTAGIGEVSEFSGGNSVFRYGLCCPNNPEYRVFVAEQIKEMSEYFTVDGMFYDMLFWNHMCYCDHCKERWEKEVGGALPETEDWKDERWLLHIRKRREWMGEFAHWVTGLTKELFGDISVEHNVAYAALGDGMTANCEEVIDACDYAGGDLYVDTYSSSFACKFYRSITKNQPFEYMVARSAPNLSVHTQIKSVDVLKSSVFLTAAHHGASLIIDAIDPVGTFNKTVFERIEDVFNELIPYEKYMKGTPIEEIGLYYSLKSKFNPNCEMFTNYLAVTSTLKTMVYHNILCGVTGGFHDIDKYKVLIASALTSEDNYDTARIIEYVKNGGNLYFSGGDNAELLREFFNAYVEGRTEETIVYIAPGADIQSSFEYFDKKHPLHFTGSAPIVNGIKPETVKATLTLPYTPQNVNMFSSIHSDPPGISTDIPAISVTEYGNGKVIWSACPFECIDVYDHRRIFVNLLQNIFGFESSLKSSADEDIEITAYETENSLQINIVLLNTSYRARKIADFTVSIDCPKKPAGVVLLPEGREIPYKVSKKTVCFEVNDLEIYNMYEIKF